MHTLADRLIQAASDAQGPTPGPVSYSAMRQVRQLTTTYISMFSAGERMADIDILRVRTALQGVWLSSLAAHYATQAERGTQ